MPSRRGVVWQCGAFGLLTAFAAVLGGVAVGKEQDAERRPNILFVLTDDQRFDTIRALGNSEIETPHLDRLVKRGMVFENAYCQGSMVPAVCAPSRTMLMTGRSLFRIPLPNAKTYAEPTLGSVFRQAGYRTLFVGKRSNSFLVGNAAFETVIYTDAAAKMTKPGSMDEPVRPTHAAQSQFTVDRAIDWLRPQDPRQPFFAYLAPSVPHDPREAPREFHQRYDPAKLSLGPNFLPQHPFDNGELRVRDELLAPHPRTEDVMRRHLADYYACITCLDHHLGRLVAFLAERGELERTLIVFSSDQGLAVGGRHGLMGKQNLYEHVKPPLIVAGPGVSSGRSAALVYLFDLLPTLCTAARLPIPAACEGASLWPILRGEKKQVRATLFAAYRNCQRMIRDERWKLLEYRVGGVATTQLFDLEHDPAELHNLASAAKHAGELARLRRLLAAAQHEFGDPADFTAK